MQKRRKDIDRESIGSFHKNPFMNNPVYEVELYDGSYHELTTKQTAEAMFSQIDTEGCHFQLLSKITDYNSNGNAI